MKKAIIAMSGGVDSSVAALLMKQKVSDLLCPNGNDALQKFLAFNFI